jgi:transcriptional regulator with XRE-family HTH domain
LEPEQRLKVSRIIRLARAEAGINQQQLADLMGVSRPSVSEWERGMKSRWSRADAVALEQALGIRDQRILVALGYEPPTAGVRPVVYSGVPLTAGQEAEVLRFIDWVRQRPPGI